MNKLNLSVVYTALSATLTGSMVLCSGLYQPAQARLTSNVRETLPNHSLISTRFEPPGDAVPPSSLGAGSRGSVQFSAPGDATPGTSVGAGSRGSVQFSAPGDATPGTTVGAGSRNNNSPTLTALLPTTQYGRTLSGRPTFFVYVPPTSSKEVFFSLQDEQGNHHYQTTLKISGGGGIISVTLPKDAPELEVGKNYMWFFAPIALGGNLMPDNYGVTGWVRRVESPITNTQNLSVSPKEQATLYAKAGVWYDTLDVLASAKQSQPGDTNLVKEWQELLEQVGLNGVATQPILEQL